MTRIRSVIHNASLEGGCPRCSREPGPPEFESEMLESLRQKKSLNLPLVCRKDSTCRHPL